MANIIDSYSESNQSLTDLLRGDGTGSGHGADAQVFTVPSNANLGSAKWYLKKTGSPTGNLLAKIYNYTGTFNVNAKPTGTALATSDPIDASTLSTSLALVTFNFSGANQILLTAATSHYAITIERFVADTSNYIETGYDGTPTQDGNGSEYNFGGWQSQSPTQYCFYVYDNVSGETTSTSSTSSSISTSSTSTSVSTSSTSTSRSTSTSSSISTSSTSISTTISITTSTSVSTSSTSSSVSTSTSLSTSSTSSSTSISTSSTSKSTSTSISTSSTSTSISISVSTSSTSQSTSVSTSTSLSTSSTSTSQSTSVSTSVSTSSTSSSTSTSSTTTLPPSTSYKPYGTIKDQVQTSAPPNSDSTIMDDTVVTMDSATALMGGQTVTQPAMRQSIDKIVPKVHIKIKR